MIISVVQLNYIVGNFNYNFKKISAAIYKNNNADLIIFSELCISGYYPYDLLHDSAFIIQQDNIINKIKYLTKKLKVGVIIGAATKVSGLKKFYNSAIVINNGKIVFTYHKQLIPNYGIFDEARHFISTKNNSVFYFKGHKLAILICEDIWYKNNEGYKYNPVNKLVNQSLDGLIIINASPSNIEKFKERQKIVVNIAKKTNSIIIYSSQVGGYDEIIYDGSSFICDKYGKLIMIAKSFDEDVLQFNSDKLLLNKYHNKQPLNKIFYNKWEFILKQIICGLYDYVNKSGFHGVVVGLSGGIDSALTLSIATLALGNKNVHAINMPSQFSSSSSIKDSVILCKNLNVKMFIRNIEEEFKLTSTNFKKTFGSIPKKLTTENMQARIRGRILMEYSNDTNLLLLSTGNKSELSVGYTTLYGDMCGSLNCIGDLYKTDVYKLAKHINNNYGDIIPNNILVKAPSAELSANQKDLDTLPNYYSLDAFLKVYLEGPLLDKKEIIKFKEIIKNNINYKERYKIYNMILNSEFKRKQASPILFISKKSFGIARRIPITSKFLP